MTNITETYSINYLYANAHGGIILMNVLLYFSLLATLHNSLLPYGYP